MSHKIHLEIYRRLTAKTICITISGVNIKVVLYWDQPFLLVVLDGSFSVLHKSGKTRFWFIWLSTFSTGLKTS